MQVDSLLRFWQFSGKRESKHTETGFTHGFPKRCSVYHRGCSRLSTWSEIHACCFEYFVLILIWIRKVYNNCKATLA